MTLRLRGGNWPLFWCLTPACQAKLMVYQWEKYGTRLEIPPPPGVSRIAWRITWDETTNMTEEDWDRLMRQPPRVEGRGGY